MLEVEGKLEVVGAGGSVERAMLVLKRWSVDWE